jgi:hypothetical protein
VGLGLSICGSEDALKSEKAPKIEVRIMDYEIASPNEQAP